MQARYVIWVVNVLSAGRVKLEKRTKVNWVKHRVCYCAPIGSGTVPLVVAVVLAGE